MYSRNSASPEPIAIGAVIQIEDGAVQTSGVTVRIKPTGVAEGDGAGTTSYSTDGIVLYTPTQAETDYTSFVLIAKKTGCIPVAVTIVTTASATPGTVVLADGVAHGGTLGSSTATLALSRLSVVSQTSDTSAVTVTGNGTGNGATFASGSGATGNSIHAAAASTNGHAFRLEGAGAGSGFYAVGGNSNAAGMAAVGGTGGGGFFVAGNGSGSGIVSTGGSTGHGALLTGGATSGAGLRCIGPTDGQGIYVEGVGEAGIYITSNESGVIMLGADAGLILQGGTGHSFQVSGTTGLLGAVTATHASNDIVGIDVAKIGGDSQSLTDLKDFVDAGYDPSTNKVQGVVLVDTTTTNTDMRGTDGAYTGTPPTAASVADAVWDEAQSDHQTAGSFGALIYVVSIAGSGDISTLDTAASSYLTAAEFLKRYDKRTVGRYCSDTGEAVASADLPTDANLLALLDDASGILEMAVLKGGRYTAAQIAALTGVAKAARNRIIADIAICLVYERRPDLFGHQQPVCYTRAMELIAGLETGSRIFGYADTIDAGLIDQVTLNREIVDDTQNSLTSTASRFFGDRQTRSR